ncbi:MAG: hypothetical protein M1813_004956 [Trichoglossum hirsutum]|nr:MAG: hypothetical protein M1813_004956 [Trichoglossum hirsutum]
MTAYIILDAPLLEAQNSGKHPGLCDSGGAFAEGLGNCNACIGYHGGGKGASFGSVKPDFEQFLDYCGKAANSPIVISSEPAKSSVPGSTASALQPSGRPTPETQKSANQPGPSSANAPPNSFSFIPGTTVPATTVGDSVIPGHTILPTSVPMPGPNQPNSYSYIPGTIVPPTTIGNSVVPGYTILPSSVLVPGSNPSDSTPVQLVWGSSTVNIDPHLGSQILAGISAIPSNFLVSSSSTDSSTNTKTTSSTTTTTTTSSSSSSSRSSGSTAAATSTSTAPRVSSAPWNIALVIFTFACIALAWS